MAPNPNVVPIGIHLDTEASRRVLSALRRVERAQVELYEACSELSAIVGMVKPWEDCGKLADRVKTFWHTLNARFLSCERWELDKI